MLVFVLFFLISFAKLNLSLWCFECTSSMPGCGERFNWLMYWSITCPESDDVCVKIVDEFMGHKTITRSCLSTIGSTRRDIPADHYEGCRPAAVDVKLANYVNHSIPEHDVKRNQYNSTWCFCYFDNACNRSNSLYTPIWLLISTIFIINTIL